MLLFVAITAMLMVGSTISDDQANPAQTNNASFSTSFTLAPQSINSEIDKTISFSKTDLASSITPIGLLLTKPTVTPSSSTNFGFSISELPLANQTSNSDVSEKLTMFTANFSSANQSTGVKGLHTSTAVNKTASTGKMHNATIGTIVKG